MKNWVLLSAVLLGLTTGSHARGAKRQDGPVDPSTDPDCTFFDTAYDTSNDCTYFEEFWGISHADFVAWNPSVQADCSGLIIGNSYCVEVTRAPSSTRTVTTSSTPTVSAKPSPTQEGLIDSCVNFYQAARGDTCDRIVSRYGTFSSADFLAWNPAVQSDCSGLQINVWYCVGIPGTPTAPGTTTSALPTNGIQTPQPTHRGMVSNCDAFYLVRSGDNCQTIAEQHGISTTQLGTWNDIGTDCRGLQADVHICVSIVGVSPTTRTSSPPSSTAPGNGIQTPQPTHRGMVANCDAFYFVQSGDSCQGIADRHGISTTQLASWNDVGTECRGLQADVNICVSVIGVSPVTTTSAPPASTAPGNGIQTPQPTQPGMVNNCDAFYFVRSGDSCQGIADSNRITLSQFTAWNDVGGSDCRGLLASVNVCVSIIGHNPTTSSPPVTTTNPGNGIQTPQPTQPGMVGNCDAFYLVKSGDGCQSIADRNGISLTQFTTWNDVGGASCPRLQLNAYVCISVTGHTPTFVTTTQQPPASTCTSAHPTPTQPRSVCNCRRWHRVVSGNTCERIQQQYSITAAQFNRWNPDVGSNCARLFLDYYVCVSSPV